MKFLRVISNLLRFDRTNWTALALCVFAATVFWAFNALNKEYSTNLSLPLRVEFDEQRFASAERIPARLTVNVTGIGWELLRKNLGQKVPQIAIPLERPQEVRRIPGATLAPHVISQLGSLRLNFVVLDTLRLSIEPRVTRKLKLTADIQQVSFRPSMGRTGPVVVLPDSVLLEGPASFLQALPDSVVIQVPQRRVSANYRESLEVLLDHREFIIRNPPVAEVMFEVGLFVEWNSKVAMPVSRGSAYTVDRDSVQLTLRLPRQDQDRLVTDALAIGAHLPEVDFASRDSVWALPRLTGVPSYASVTHVDSVILRKKSVR